MSLEVNKDSFMGYSWKAVVIIFTVLSTVGGTLYAAALKYNQISELADNYKPYDDTELKNEISRLKIQLSGMESSVNNVKDSMVATSNQLVAVSDKASTAKGEAMEAKASANGTAREVDAALKSVRSEVVATKEGLEARMKALQRATSNPLGN